MGKEVTSIVTGTGAALDIDLGFIPDVVEILNTTTLTKFVFNRFDTVNTIGLDVDALGGVTAATNGIVLPGVLDEDKAFTLSASAVVNVNTNLLQVTAKQLDYVDSIDHTPRFKDAAQSTGGLFDAAELDPVPLEN